jgi:SynChlorMet cassette protein ScmC
MNIPISYCPKHLARLTLADGISWNIIATDNLACNVVSALAKTMQLQPPDINSRTKFEHCNYRRIFVHIEDRKIDSAQFSIKTHLITEGQDTFCALDSSQNNELQLINLSMFISHYAQSQGGVLLHGALAEYNGKGVILAGPGDRGKTTASQRLPYLWHSLCDDATLVIPDKNGMYWAHPWPTWSAFMFKGPGGSWDVQDAVPLKGIFFLEKYHEDRFKPLGIAKIVCMLNSSAEQVSWLKSGHSETNALRELRLQRFDNICSLAQAVPAFILQMSLKGAFWLEIERALNDW